MSLPTARRLIPERLAGPCVAHKRHSPVNLTVEFHHVTPVAWQLSTPVSSPPFPGKDQAGRGMLWDARGELLCPTGHRNTHAWIVELMHAIANLGQDDPHAAYLAVKPRRRVPFELTSALAALMRYQPYGSLVALTAAGEWGQS